jgi:2-methylcitrate dehydratase PrpD
LTNQFRQTITREISGYVEGMTFDSIPVDVLSELRRCIADGLGVIISGIPAECSQIIHRYIADQRPQPIASILGTRLKASTSLAALANGVAGHAEDYDDTQISSSPNRVYGLLTHPTVPALSAGLAIAEDRGVSGRDFITALCTGIEVECKIAEAIDPKHYLQGFHSTGTIGVFGATAVAARLEGLTLEQTQHALGIAASKSAGIRVNFGTMTKPYHAGAAAENGIIAARLAKLGYKADPNGLDGKWGFLQVTAGGVDQDRIIGKLGLPYTLRWPGVSVKPYPCGSLAHPTMDALLDVLLKHDIKPEQLEEIRVGAGKNILDPLRYQDPQSGLEAKFSLRFCLAVLALYRRAGVREFKDAVVNRSEVRDMMGRVDTYQNLEIEALGTDRIRSVLDIRLRDGRVIHQEASTSRGTPERPMSWSEIEGKFYDCIQDTLPVSKGVSAIDLINRLETLPNLADLIGTLTP